MFYLFSSWTMEVSLCPLITICCSFSCFATWMMVKNRAPSYTFHNTKNPQRYLLQSCHDLHLLQRSLRLQSRFWRKRHRSWAWRRCRWEREPGPPERSRMIQGERGSNRVHRWGRHELGHQTMRPTNRRISTILYYTIIKHNWSLTLLYIKDH